MARQPRKDSPDSWHYVMNRGIARRTIFEDRACVRYVLACLARVVRQGELEVHAYVLMATHFHLLVRCPNGDLSGAMQLVQNTFVRWFNRRNRRDGPLFRGRFSSRLVGSLRYRRVLVTYIDRNPVQARIVNVPEAYPHCSAKHYCSNQGPRWLERSWVEGDARARTGSDEFTGAAYREAFGAETTKHIARLVEARLQHPSQDPDPLDDLVHAAPASAGRLHGLHAGSQAPRAASRFNSMGGPA